MQVDKTCILCLTTLHSLSSYNDHISLEHKFVCQEQECDTQFVSRVKLEEHKVKVHNMAEEHINHNMCQVCGQHFTRPENLRKHRKKPHVYHCEHCGISFTALDRKEQHCLTVHQVESFSDH